MYNKVILKRTDNEGLSLAREILLLRVLIDKALDGYGSMDKEEIIKTLTIVCAGVETLARLIKTDSMVKQRTGSGNLAEELETTLENVIHELQSRP